MTSCTRLTLPVSQWPDQDATRLQITKQRRNPFIKKNPGAAWTPARRRKLEEAYGQWLAWLSKTGLLDPAVTPGLRITPTRIEQYITYLATRVAPVTVAINICYLCTMLEALEPKIEWRWLRRIGQHLKNTAVPIRDRRQAVPPAKELYDLAVNLIREAESRQTCTETATLFRDGLMIGFLAALPLRLSNFSSIEIGVHLIYRHNQYWLEFPASEMKSRHRALEVGVPCGVASWLELYLGRYRKVLMERRNTSKPPTRALWLTQNGLRMSSNTVRAQIERRTAKAFGRAIWPHLFRHAAATSIAIEAPEHAWIIRDVLNHAARATADKYYIQANSLSAGRVYQQIIQAMQRDSNTFSLEGK